ncbi:nucleoside triphosphate pyrophosphohydrolase [Paenibacillus montanisoli]|uniref:Phosphoribosyl-ATP pyrophosphohydrolase n=1 Tax=Paenibacillus montanisoli TaxID=2081970 RepID=A0A328TRG6_9BACL|nr:nucleoside triphosphate pyrophosphohydrolase [Paenibacillus montanisoli]RAP73187.1 phosphoribosyl-ATP pyrophosphohydrolase [Paenibacillus montanisoli]
MPVYNKLVRDRIPEIIVNSGRVCSSRILDESAYKVELRGKLSEELREYLEAPDDESAIEELADLLELLHALAAVHGFSAERLETIRMKKAAERGGFEGRVYLEEVR